jgi:hypothetical protein
MPCFRGILDNESGVQVGAARCDLDGLRLAIHRVYRGHLRPRLSGRLCGSRAYGVVCWVLTLGTTCLAWIFFRSHQLDESLQIVRNIFAPVDPGTSLLPLSAWLLVSGTIALAWAEGRWGLLERINNSSVAARGVAVGVALLLLSAFSDPGSEVSFIYFQF